jgi:hypothetical protein
LLSIGAFLFVALCTIYAAKEADVHHLYGADMLHGALAGFFGGVFLAGLFFGPLAALYDIRDSLRKLAAQVDAPVMLRSRIEPRLAAHV